MKTIDRRYRYDLKIAQDIAVSRSGKCLSKEYKNDKIKLIWQCGVGHIWKANINHIVKRNTWCLRCTKYRRLNILDAKLKAYLQDGECLSDYMKNGSEKLFFKCSRGHTWKASLYKIVGNRWCPKCAGTQKLTQQEVSNIIEQNGGKLISKYKRSELPLKIRCNLGHVFKKSISKITNRHEWCPYCHKKSVGEVICRLFLEELFGTEFPCMHPEWLNGLELDGFSETLGLAFEHNGAQHYDKKVYLKRFLNPHDSFESLQLRDIKKIEICRERDIKLIIIPDLFYMTGLKKLGKCIKSELERLNVIVPPKINNIQVDNLICKMNKGQA